MPLEAGATVARLGARLDDDAFDRFERRLERARRDARDDVEVPLKADVDERGFRRFDSRMDDTERRSRRFGAGVSKSFAGLRFAVFGAATAGAAAAGVLGKTFVDTAASIGESTSKIETILGRHGSVLTDFAQTSARELGLSRAAALEATGGFAGLFTTLGQSRKDAADMSVTMTTLAADMASFNNATPEEALTALQAGLRGEAEPLRRFNVLLDDATLRQRAVKDGLIETTKEALDPQQKAMAAYGVILEQTKVQQGDFERTSSGLPNQLRILRARVSDLGATMGEKLLPVVNKAVTGLNELLSGGGGAGGRLAGITGAIRSAFGGIGDFVSDFVGRNRENLDDVRQAFAGMARSVGRIVRGVGDAFRDVFGSGTGIRKDVDAIMDALLAFASFIYREVYEPIVRRMVPGIVATFRGLFTAIRGVVRLIAGVLTGDFGKAWDGVKDIFGGALTALGGIIRAGTAPIRQAASLVWRGIAGGAEAAWDGVTGIVKRGVDFIAGGVTSLLGIVESALNAASKLPFVGGKFRGLADDVRGARRDIDRYRESLRDTDEEHGRTRNIKRMQGEVDTLRDRLRNTRRGTELYRETAEALRKKQAELNRQMRLADPAGRKGAKGPQALGDSAGGMADAVNEGLGELVAGFNELAPQLGGIKELRFKTRQARRRNRPRRQSPGSEFGPGPGDTFLNEELARGGLIPFGEPGVAGFDTIPANIGGRDVMVAPGEVAAVFNRHQLPLVDFALDNTFGVGGLAGLFNAVDRPHYMARGGYVQGAQPPRNPRTRAFAEEMFGLGFNVTSAGEFRGTGTLHDAQLALDFGDSVNNLRDVWRTLVPRRADLAELFGPSSFRPPTYRNGQPGSFVAGHDDHVHAGLGAGGIGALGNALAAVLPRTMLSGPAGALRTMGQRTLDKVRKGANALLSGGAGGLDGFTGGGNAAANMSLGRRMLAALWPLSEWPPLRTLWHGESGWDHTARNPSSGAFGIPQSLPASKMASAGPDWQTNPATQIKWGLGYIKGRYGSPSKALAAWRSRSPHWYARGGLVGRGGEGLTRRGRRYVRGRAGAVAGLTKTISDLGRRYDLRSREFDLTEETFVIEGDEGTPPTLDQAAIDRKLAELEELRTIRVQIRNAYGRMVRVIDRILRVYRTARNRVQKALDSVERRLKRLDGRKGKEAARTRRSLGKRASTYRERLSDYRGRYAEWSTEREDADYERQSADLDARELAGEMRDIDPDRLLAEAMEGYTPPEPPDAGGDDTAGEGPSEPAEPAQAPPTPEQIAAAATAQLAAFQSDRASLFGGFGANFITPSAGAQEPGAGILSGAQLAAGTRYFGGGAGGSEGGVISGAGGIVVQGPLAVFTGPAPADPHTFTHATLHELQAAI